MSTRSGADEVMELRLEIAKLEGRLEERERTILFLENALAQRANAPVAPGGLTGMEAIAQSVLGGGAEPSEAETEYAEAVRAAGAGMMAVHRGSPYRVRFEPVEPEQKGDDAEA